MTGERTIYAQDSVAGVVHYDEIGDGVEIFDPLLLGALDPGKEARIFECYGRVSGECF